MNKPMFNIPSLGKKLTLILGITASLMLTGCATNLSQENTSSTDDVLVTKPSERVAIRYNKPNNNDLNSLPPEISAFLREGKVDNSKISAVTPTRVGTGDYNHAILNNVKATDVVAINPSKFAPPNALPDYGYNNDDNYQKPVDFVAKAPAYFADFQPEPVQVITRSTSYASVKVQNRKNSTVTTSKFVKTSFKSNNNSTKSKNIAPQRVKASLPARKK